jgi:hypothetical protein
MLGLRSNGYAANGEIPYIMEPVTSSPAQKLTLTLAS